MPELPDVDVYRRYLNATALHQNIQKVEIESARLIEGQSMSDFANRLKGHAMVETSRHGKYLFARLDGGGWLAFHFGMTGKLAYYKGSQDRPDYSYIRFHFKDAYELAYVIPRKLGTLQVIEKPSAFISSQDLGPDALADDFSSDDFIQRYSSSRGMIKTRLMNQSLMAGIGNIYSDEILYQTRLHPRIKIKDLDEDRLGKLYAVMKQVMEKAIDCQADPQQFPDDWLIPHRQDGADCPACDGQVKRIEISGRGCYICPSCQRE
ncbi:MAG: DNA-formamidopyrimidine glycosylase family protein [Anaerolineales bacterium]